MRNFMKRADGENSKTMVMAILFLLFSVAALLAKQVGYDEFVPSDELILIVNAVVAVIAMILRRFTNQAMA